MKKENELHLYKTVAVFLWEKIAEIDNHDEKLLRAYGDLIVALTPLFDKHLPFGFMRELNLWIGVKRDAPDAFKDYGAGIKKDYHEVFSESTE